MVSAPTPRWPSKVGKERVRTKMVSLEERKPSLLITTVPWRGNRLNVKRKHDPKDPPEQ